MTAETPGASPAPAEKRKASRIDLTAPIEFFVDADILRATSVDISQTGLCFTTRDPFVVALRLSIDGTKEDRRARILWARPEAEGGMRFGMEFVEDDAAPEIE